MLGKKEKTKGQIEAEISEAVTGFEKEYMGRGPLETKTYIIEDMVIVRLKGVLTRAEYRLVSRSATPRRATSSSRCAWNFWKTAGRF
jgi:uncharacterized protein YbcI